MSSASSREYALGIDFGSTNTSAAAVIEGRVQLVLDGGEPQIPSVIFLPRRGEPLVGSEAVRQGHTDPAGCVRAIKRLLGRRYDDPLAHAIDGQVGYKVVAGVDGSAVLRIRDAEW